MDRSPSGKEETPTAFRSDESQIHEVDVKSLSENNKDHERSEGLLSRYHKKISKEQNSTGTPRDSENFPHIKVESSTDGMEGDGSAENQKTPNRANINHRQTHSNSESMTARVAQARRNAISEGSLPDSESHDVTQKRQSWSEGVEGSRTTRVTTGLGEHESVSANSGESPEPLPPPASLPIPIPRSTLLPQHHVGSEGVYRDALGLSSEMLTSKKSKSRTAASESPKYKVQLDASSFGHNLEKSRTPRSMTEFGATVAMYNKLKDLSVELEQKKGGERGDMMEKRTKDAGMKDEGEKN